MTKSLTIVLTNPQSSILQNRIIAKTKKSKIEFSNLAELLFSLFGFSKTEELPVAAVSGLAEGLDTKNGFWLRADPVELKSDLANVYLLGNQHLEISANLKNELRGLLNNFLQEDGIILHAPNPKRWYLQLPKPTNIKTHNPENAVGKNIYSYLPYGSEDQVYWKKLFTEIQMLLHEKSVVNALWFWGAGQLPELPQSNWQKVWTDEILTKGLAKIAKVESTVLPKDVVVEMQTEGSYLTVLEDLPNMDYFKSLISALRRGRISHLTLYSGQFRYDVSRFGAFRFW